MAANFHRIGSRHPLGPRATSGAQHRARAAAHRLPSANLPDFKGCAAAL